MSKQPGRKARGLSKDEHDLWDVVTRSVAPLKARKARARPEADTGPLPEVTGLTVAPSMRMRKTLGFCRSMSVAPL